MKRRLWVISTTALTSFVLVGASALAGAAEIRLFSSNALADVLAEVIPEYERSSGNKVVAIIEPTSVIMSRIKNGETADVIILIQQSVQELQRGGRIVANSETDLARTSLGVAVKAGMPKPDIGSIDGFRTTVLRANSIAVSEVGASGMHFRQVLDRLWLAEVVRPKLKLLPGGARTAELVARGEADLAVQMMSELQGIPGVEIVGPLPGDLHYQIVLTAGLDVKARESAAGADLIRFLSSLEIAPTFRKKGMEEVRP
jgi:molybdate transport system substrate-binding protein